MLAVGKLEEVRDFLTEHVTFVDGRVMKAENVTKMLGYVRVLYAELKRFYDLTLLGCTIHRNMRVGSPPWTVRYEDPNVRWTRQEFHGNTISEAIEKAADVLLKPKEQPKAETGNSDFEMAMKLAARRIGLAVDPNADHDYDNNVYLDILRDELSFLNRSRKIVQEFDLEQLIEDTKKDFVQPGRYEVMDEVAGVPEGGVPSVEHGGVSELHQTKKRPQSVFDKLPKFTGTREELEGKIRKAVEKTEFKPPIKSPGSTGRDIEHDSLDRYKATRFRRKDEEELGESVIYLGIQYEGSSDSISRIERFIWDRLHSASAVMRFAEQYGLNAVVVTNRKDDGSGGSFDFLRKGDWVLIVDDLLQAPRFADMLAVVSREKIEKEYGRA